LLFSWIGKNPFLTDPSDIEMDNLAKPNPILRLKQSIQSLQSTQHGQCPTMALPMDPQPTPMVPTVVPELTVPTSNDIAIAPMIPTDPLFPPILQPQRPYHLGEDITEVGRGTGFIMAEEWDNDHYWITCQMDNTGVEFSTQVG